MITSSLRLRFVLSYPRLRNVKAEIRGNNSLVHTILPDIGITGHHLSQPLWYLSFPAPRAAGRDQRLPSN